MKFAAANSFLKTDAACNNVTYYFRIHVKAKADSVIAAHGHYKDGIYYHISNQAKRRLDSSQMADTQETNMSWVRGIIERNCSIRKTDAADSTKGLTGAVFQAYAWMNRKKSYAITGEQFAYTEKTKLYTKKLQYTDQNKGNSDWSRHRHQKDTLGTGKKISLFWTKTRTLRWKCQMKEYVRHMVR